MKTLGLAVLGLLLMAPAARASKTGSVGFATPILTQADASPTGDINTSDVFSLEALVTTTNESGIFAGLPIQNFGTVVFDKTVGTSLLISSTEFGSFQSSSIKTITNIAGFLNLLIGGTWTAGSFNGGLHGNFPGVIRMSFTQTPVTTGEISFSGTMSTVVPTSVVPEPSTSFLFLSGVGLILAGTTLRKTLFA